MGLYDIDAVVTTNLNDIFKDYESPLKDTDIITWTPEWQKWHGQYRDIPENQATIDVWCKWIIGKKITFLKPETITIIANRKSRILKYVQFMENTNINLGTTNAEIQEEIQKNIMEKTIVSSWDPDEMFHISNNRIADEIHGIPESEKLELIGQWKKQASEDQSIIIRRYGKPTYFYEVDTDDDTEIADIETKINKTITEFSNMVVPK